jgi:membrane associated rhomboid family serine protease
VITLAAEEDGRSTISVVLYRLSGFRPLFNFFSVLFMLSVATSFAVVGLQIDPILLASSPQTPWGVVTGIFLHAGPVHLHGNFLVLMLYFGCYVLAGPFYRPEHTKRKAKFLASACLLGGIIANAVSLWYVPLPSLGSSGVVYAFMGVVFVESVVNAAMISSDKTLRLRLWRWAGFNWGLIGFIVFPSIFAPEEFFVFAPLVNSVCHMTGFVAGIVLTAVFEVFWTAKHGKTIRASLVEDFPPKPASQETAETPPEAPTQ